MAEKEASNINFSNILKFIFKNIHIISIVIGILYEGYNQYSNFVLLEKSHDAEQKMAQAYYKETDSLKTVIYWMKEQHVKLETHIKDDDTYIESLYLYKFPYGKYATH